MEAVQVFGIVFDGEKAVNTSLRCCRKKALPSFQKRVSEN